MKHDWIKCEDRLPAHEERVLIVFMGQVIDNVTYYAEDGIFQDGYDSAWLPNTEVVYWMPLPEPPCTE